MLPLGIICAYVNRKGEPTHLPIFKGTYLVELQSITYSSQITCKFISSCEGLVVAGSVQVHYYSYNGYYCH